jgi:hypothetical protein
MKSIFIWKARTPLPKNQKDTITIYTGLNWYLDEMPQESISYEVLESIQYDVDGIIYHIQPHSTNWVGLLFLEKITLPYSKWMEDHEGIYDQIGEWCRYRYKKEMDLSSEELQREFDRIRRTMVQKSI